jgi:hypothetical protein
MECVLSQVSGQLCFPSCQAQESLFLMSAHGFFSGGEMHGRNGWGVEALTLVTLSLVLKVVASMASVSLYIVDDSLSSVIPLLFP